MANDKTADIQARVEMLLKGDPSKSYSKEEIIEELSNASSMTNPKSQIDSTCRNGTVYFQWR
jgi:hypothetical protein